MLPTKKGKFCTKEVFDFTTFSDEQLIKRLEKDDDLCGRFTVNLLNRNLVLQRKKITLIYPMHFQYSSLCSY